jgi:thiamine-phosphate pyrophosphorylase
MSFNLPRIYAIADADIAPNLIERAEALIRVGAEIIQLRAKKKTAREAYEAGLALRDITRRAGVLFAVNDRPDLAAVVEADVLHLGQDDMSPTAARMVFQGIIGLSTHNEAQVRAAQSEGVDYIGFGPVFGTSTKENPDPVVGIDGLRMAVRLSGVPVVAVGGITLENVAEVWKAGAASVAVISALGKTPAESEAAMRAWLASAPK